MKASMMPWRMVTLNLEQNHKRWDARRELVMMRSACIRCSSCYPGSRRVTMWRPGSCVAISMPPWRCPRHSSWPASFARRRPPLPLLLPCKTRMVACPIPIGPGLIGASIMSGWRDRWLSLPAAYVSTPRVPLIRHCGPPTMRASGPICPLSRNTDTIRSHDSFNGNPNSTKLSSWVLTA